MTHQIRWERSRDAAGAIPWTFESDYRGFTTWMTPEEFLALNPGAKISKPGSMEYLSKNLVFAPLVLQVEWDDEGGGWKVIGHEGRHRAMVARSLGEDSIPVDILGPGFRRRNLTDDMISAPITSDDDADRLAVVLPSARPGRIRVIEE